MKKLIFLCSAVLMTAAMGSTAMAAELNVTVEGSPVQWTDAKPFINEDSRTLVPLRPIANALGLSVTWNDDTNQASFSDGSGTVEFTINSDTYHFYLNDQPDIEAFVEMDTTAVIANSRTYAPARYLAESFGYDVGWDEASRSVQIVRADRTDDADTEDPIPLPEVPAGQAASVFPITTEAGQEMNTIIAVDGASFKEDPDFFTYSYTLDTDIELLSQGMTYEFADGCLFPSLQPTLATVPGTYPVSWTLPAEWFTDTEEDVVVSTTLTVTAPAADTAMALAFENLEYGIYINYGDRAEQIAAAIAEDTGWLLEGTPFRLTMHDGTFGYDENNNFNDTWLCTLTMTNTATGASVSEEIRIPLQFYPEF